MLHLHGPGGIGKTTLLRELARLAALAGRRVIAFDARDVEPSREAVLRALGPRVPRRAVVLIDGYERLAGLDEWLRENLLPELPADALVALAGRARPALAWRTDLAWAPLARIVELGNLDPGESASLLASRGIPPAEHAAVQRFTRGHPLALSMVGDLLARSPALAFDADRVPDVVRHLLGLFLESVPRGPLRKALEVCALARTTTQPLLSALLGEERGRTAFEWLRRQPFVESGRFGVFPHDLVRELLLADARWRDEAGLRELSRRVYATLFAQIAAAQGPRRQRLQMDALFVTRSKPSNVEFFAWDALDDVTVEPALGADAAWIAALVERHEGPESARLARLWWRLQPSAFHVFRDAAGERFGFLALLELARVPAGAASQDPAASAARAFVERHGPVRRGEDVVHLRWWMHADAYQAVTAAINLTAMHVVAQCVTRPGLAWNFVAMADASFWAAHFAGVNFAPAPEADFTVGGHRYGVFAHDWRIETPPQWLSGAGIPMRFARPGRARLSEVEFRAAVQQALRDYTRPDALADNPLSSRPDELRRRLREAVEALRGNPRDLKLQRALWHTYFEPLATQEAVAERLDLPFSTYRHHLRRGIDRVALRLWQRRQELDGS